jgi:small-conductance mechanosensitive channel
VAGGIAGVMVGFASQRVIGNLVSGLFLFAERPMKIGDSVNVDGQTGIVKDIRILSTTIRTFDGLGVRIPNEDVFTSSITNYVAHAARRFDFEVGIRYEDDAEEAVAVLRGLVEEQPTALKSPAPVVAVTEFGDSAVKIQVLAWGPRDGWWGAKTAILSRVQKALEARGIEMAYPQVVVHKAK